MKNTLGLGGDGDDVDFINDVEAAFGVKLEEAELETCLTFGDLYDCLCRHLQPVERGDFPCLAAAAFWRLRRAIVADHGGLKVMPDTPLRDLYRGQRVSAWWKRLGDRSGLRLPEPVLHGSFWIMMAASVLVPAAVDIANDESSWMRILLVAPLLWIIAGRLWPKRPPVATLGDLARASAARSVGSLARSDTGVRARDVWAALELLAREYAPEQLVIDRQTTLIG